MGLDVEAVFREGSLDFVVGQDGNVVIDTGIQAKWLPDAANASRWRGVLPSAAAGLRRTRRHAEHRDVPCPRQDRRVAGVRRPVSTGTSFGPSRRGNTRSCESSATRRSTGATLSGTCCRLARGSKASLLLHRSGSFRCSSKKARPPRSEIWVADDVDSARADGEMRKPDAHHPILVLLHRRRDRDPASTAGSSRRRTPRSTMSAPWR